MRLKDVRSIATLICAAAGFVSLHPSKGLGDHQSGLLRVRTGLIRCINANKTVPE